MARVETHEAFNTIPSAAWNIISSHLKEQNKTSGKGKILIRKFRYVIAEQKWKIGASKGCVEFQNLFFEYLASSSRDTPRNLKDISEDFIAIQFDDKVGTSESVSRISSFQSDEIREKLLRSGLKQPESNNIFHVLGCSNSQIKDFTFLFRKCKSLEKNVNYLKTILPKIEELDAKKGVAKRVKYAGLLFSGVRTFINLPKDIDIHKAKSVRNDKYDFTDGPGLVSLKLAKNIAKQMNLREVPSVFQIRYGGKVQDNDSQIAKLYLCKGVLLVDPTEDERHILSFRSSMLKIEISDRSTWQECMGMKLGIVDYSKKTIGKLNQQTLCLLTASVPEDALLEIQKAHLQAIEKCWDDPFWLGYVAAMYDNTDKNRSMWKTFNLLIKHIVSRHQLTKDSLSQHLPQSYRELCTLRKRLYSDDRKLQIPIGCSRYLFGAVFPEKLHSFLKEGQCLVFTDKGLLVDTVIISRSPSYSAGDVRVLKAVDLPQELESLRQLRNCILFATQGDRPEADKMGGGDMDGDLYLVIWDKRLMKYSGKICLHEAANYDAPQNSNQQTEKAKDDWIAYMARFDNSMLGKIDRAFYKVIQEKGLLSPEAKRLNTIFSGLVDKNPESLDEFERINGAIYLVASDSALWDRMIFIQNKYLDKLNRYFPSNENIEKFVEICCSNNFLRDMNSRSWFVHFETNIGKPEFSAFLQILKNNFPDYKENIINKVTKYNEQAPNTKRLNEIFEQTLARWNQAKDDTFNQTLKESHDVRERLLKDYEMERGKKLIKLDYFQKKRGKCEELLRKALSIYSKSSSSDHVHHHIERLKSMIQNLSEKEEDFLTGKTRRDKCFELEIGQTKLSDLNQENQLIESSISKTTKMIVIINEEISVLSNLFKKSKKLYQDRLTLQYNVDIFYKSMHQNEFFDSNMLSESSYLMIRKLVKDIERLNVIDGFSLSQHLNVILEKTQEKKRNENRIVLRLCFEAVSRVKQILVNSHIIQNSYETLKKREIELEEELRFVEDEYRSKLVDKKRIEHKVNSITRRKRQKTSPSSAKNKGVDRKEELPDDINIKNMSDILKEIQAEITSLQKTSKQIKGEKSSLNDKMKQFRTSCKTLVEKIDESMSGELLNTVPSSIFVEFQKIVQSCEGATNEKSKISATYSNIRNISISDPKIFKMFKDTIEDIERCCGKNKEKEKQSIVDIASRISKAHLKLQEAAEELEDLKKKKKIVSVQINDLSEANATMAKDIEAMYCPETLKMLETDMNNASSLEEGINVGLDHVNFVINESCNKWTDTLNNEKEDYHGLKKSLLRLNKSVLRVCGIEKNRLLGMPRNGKYSGRLPVYSQRAELKKCLNENDVAIVIAGTGCGKSTQIPQYLADDLLTVTSFDQMNGKRDFIRVCCSQPRRLAAQRIAERVCSEYISNIGDMVGFRVGKRGSNIEESQKVSKNTRIEFVTEGWLLHSLAKSSKLLENYDCIVVDEAHERNLETDLLLCLLKRHLEQNQGKKIKVVVMSATIDPKLFSNYFHCCPVIDCPGKQYPVEEFFRPLEKGKSGDNEDDPIVSKAVRVLFEITECYGREENFEPGDCLIFLSGSRQITHCVQKINSTARKMKMSYIVAYPLYAQMPETEKDAATDPLHRTGLNKETDGKHHLSRKIICCTNIAETSLTIGKVRFVIESGFAKKIGYDAMVRSKVLTEQVISKASANQRKGRAGRTEPGRCYYLYSERFKADNMPEYESPKILANPVDRLIIRSLVMSGESVENLGLLDCPGSLEIDAAKRRLNDLRFIDIDKNGSVRLTKQGKIANGLSMLDMEAVRMILNSQMKEFNCFDRAIKLGAILSYDEDFFFDDTNTEEMCGTNSSYHYLGDHFHILSYLEAFEKITSSSSKNKQKQWCKQNSIIFSAMYRIQLVIKESYNFLKRHNNASKELSELAISQASRDEERLLGALVSGYFSQLCQCIEPRLPLKMGFLSIESSLNIKIGKRNLRLNSLLGDKDDDDELDYISDSDDETFEKNDDDDGDGDDDNDDVTKKNRKSDTPNPDAVTTCSFIIYGNLFVKEYNTSKLILAEDATLINDGAYLEKYAPAHWLERVNFDPSKQSICKFTFARLGRNLLYHAINFLKEKEKELEDEKIMYMVRWSKNSVSIYGPEKFLRPAVCQIEDIIDKRKSDMINNDCVKDQLKRTFKCGLKYHGKISLQNQSPVVSFQGLNRKLDFSFWRVNEKCKKKGLIEIYCNRVNIDTFSQGLAVLFPNIVHSIKWNRIELNFQSSQKRKPKIQDDKTMPMEKFKDAISKKLNKTMFLAFIQHMGTLLKSNDKKKNIAGPLNFTVDESAHELYVATNAQEISGVVPKNRSHEKEIDIFKNNMTEHGKVVEILSSFLTAKEKQRMRLLVIDFVSSMVIRNIAGVRTKISSKIQNETCDGKRKKMIDTFLQIEDKIILSPTLVTITDGNVEGNEKLKKWHNLWGGIGEEWNQRHHFWKILCDDLSNEFSSKTMSVAVIFSPSRGQFEISCVNPTIRGNVKKSILCNLMKMCETKCSIASLSEEAIPKWKMWTMVSIIEEMKSQFRDILFRISFVTTLNSHTNTLTGNRRTNDVISCYCSHTEIDFEKIDSITDGGGKFLGLNVDIYGFNKNLDHARTALKSALLEMKNGSIAMVEKEESETKKKKNRKRVCCMCRRYVSDDKSAPNKYINSKSNDSLAGNRLSLCGCLFCRTCFLNASAMCLKGHFPIKCLRCDSPVLAKDIERIVRPFTKEKELKNQMINDWDFLANLSEIYSCKENAEVSGQKCLVCPDCSTPFICDKNDRYATCRGRNCGNQFCTKCGRDVICGFYKDECKMKRCMIESTMDEE